MINSFLASECEFWRMTEELAAQCQPYGCTKDKQMKQEPVPVFDEMYLDYSSLKYEMLYREYYDAG